MLVRALKALHYMNVIQYPCRTVPNTPLSPSVSVLSTGSSSSARSSAYHCSSPQPEGLYTYPKTNVWILNNQSLGPKTVGFC